MRPLPPFLICLLLLGCRARPEETARAPSRDTVEWADTGGPAGQPVGAARGAVEFEAPPLIPAMRAQLDQLARPEARHDPTSLSSYSGAASRLVDAMEADLVRVGLADTGAFKLLSDSVVNDLGGGTGLADPPSAERLSVDTDRVRRLIALYENWMRQAAK
jgi:hypothetical protein